MKKEPTSLSKFESMTTPIVYDKLVKRGICTTTDWKIICTTIKQMIKANKLLDDSTSHQDWNILYVSIHKYLNDPTSPYDIRIKVVSHFDKYLQYVINVELDQDHEGSWYIDGVTAERILK